MNAPQRLLIMVGVLIALMVFGTLGYWLIEWPEYTLLEALYMTVITLTTVGYREVHDPSPAGMVFTILLLLVGVFVLAYSATEIVRSVVSGELHDMLGRRFMARSLAGLKDHLIVCGYGRMGKFVCREFSRQGIEFVVVDRSEQLLAEFNLTGGIALVGDATSDETLKRAGVERARGLVTVAPHDADNLYITMSARLLNARLFIVARAESDEAEQKLMRAGADRVVAPYALGGTKIAQTVLRPTVLEFIELATRTEQLELQIEQTVVAVNSPLAGASLAGSRLRQDMGLIIVAIKKRDGTMVYTPPAEAVLEAGDTLVALGRRNHLDQLEKLARGGE
jgi:voltage-gated potassium channel